MNISRENIDELNAVIKLTIEREDYEARVADVLKSYQKKAQMPGFRPGKVPAGLIKKMYGNAATVDEINKLVSENLSNHLTEEKLEILGEPLPSETQQPIDFINQSSFEFAFDIALAPKVELNLTKRDKIPFYTLEMSEELVDSQLKNLTGRFGENKVVENVSADSLVKGSIVQLDDAGNVLENGIFAEDTVLSVNVIKDKKEQKKFIGKAAEEEIVFDVKKAFPNDTEISYILKITKEQAAEISGSFRLIIKEITEFVEPELTQDLFDKVFGVGVVSSEEEMRAKVKEDLEKNFSLESDYRFSVDARNKLTSKVDFQLPEDFLKRWMKSTNRGEEKLTDEQLDKNMPSFLEDLKWHLIKNELIKVNELKIQESDVIEFAKKSAKAQFMQYGLTNIPDDYIDNYAMDMLKDQQQGRQMAEGAITDKVIDYIKEAVNLDEKVVTRDEFNKLFEKN
jgi:trigger factor